jgi:hypothetical protein
VTPGSKLLTTIKFCEKKKLKTSQEFNIQNKTAGGQVRGRTGRQGKKKNTEKGT